MTLTIGSLFSGIGGLELGLERALGGRVVWQVERDAFCRGVLAKHWPDTERHDDVRNVTGLHHVVCDLDDDCGCPVPPARLAPVDVICGGFPCQDVANHGSREGLDGARSGLWSEYARLVGELQPRWVVIENVEALRRRGLDRVLSDLAACGYDAQWQTLRAADVGAPHGRARLFVVAYPGAERRAELGEAHDLDWNLARRNVADRRRASFPPGRDDPDGWQAARAAGRPSPGVRRVADGIPRRVDRVGALGNAVAPAMSELVGEAIRLAEAA